MGTWWRAVAAIAVALIIGACGGPPTPHPVALNTTPPAGSIARCASVSLATSEPSPITAGQLVILSAAAHGCAQPQYRFLLTDATGAGGTVTQDWSSEPTWSWSTAGTAAGRYLARVDARAESVVDGPPDASAYVSFVVLSGLTPAPLTCKLPVSGALPGSGGFIQMPAGVFTADAASNVKVPGQPDPSGLRRGFTYDPVHGRWLPVPRDWVMPDFSSYVYVGTEYPRVSNQPALHLVNVQSGVDSMWTNGDQIYGFPIALRPEGVYGAPGPEIITMVDPLGLVTTVDQGHLGLFAVITPAAIFATRSSTPGLTEVERVDLRTQAAARGFSDGNQTVLPIGVDASGSPIIAVGTQLPNARISATEIWIVPTASTDAQPAGRLIYSDAAHPLTILGSALASAGAIWIETDQGLWFDSDPATRMTLASSFSGYIAGGCL